MRRKRAIEGDMHSDSSSSASDLPYPSGRNTLMSSPLKAPFFSDAVGSSNGSSGHRKRTYLGDLDNAASSPSKRFRAAASPTAHKSTSASAHFNAAAGAGPGAHVPWKDTHQLAQSSPIKPRRQQHFTTSNGPDVSFFTTRQHLISDSLSSPNLAAASDDDDDLLPAHSFNIRSSPPRTPPMRSSRRSRDNTVNGGSRTAGKPEEGADLLIYLANSPSPAVKNGRRSTSAMEPPSTPPQKSKNLDLPSSMLMTPGGGNLFPNTPGQNFDFSDFVNITPSPAQKQWKTPVALSAARTPLSAARRRLTFDEPMP